MRFKSVSFIFSATILLNFSVISDSDGPSLGKELIQQQTEEMVKKDRKEQEDKFKAKLEALKQKHEEETNKLLHNFEQEKVLCSLHLLFNSTFLTCLKEAREQFLAWKTLSISLKPISCLIKVIWKDQQQFFQNNSWHFAKKHFK